MSHQLLAYEFGIGRRDGLAEFVTVHPVDAHSPLAFFDTNSSMAISPVSINGNIVGKLPMFASWSVQQKTCAKPSMSSQIQPERSTAKNRRPHERCARYIFNHIRHSRCF